MSVQLFFFDNVFYFQTLCDVLLHPIVFKLLLSNLPITIIFEFIDILGFLFIFTVLNYLLLVLRDTTLLLFDKNCIKRLFQRILPSILFSFRQISVEIRNFLIKYVFNKTHVFKIFKKQSNLKCMILCL